MKKKFLLAVLLLCTGVANSQTIPPDSLYLSQTPPGNTPVIFQLPITSGLRPVERIAVSNDGTELYYGQLNTYPPTVLKINYFKYQNNSWNGPFFLFDSYLGPALSPNDSMMFMQKIVNSSQAVSYYSVRTGSGWSVPEKLFQFDQQSHYSQLTNLNNYYLSTVFPGSSLKDIARVVIGTDTALVNLGPPICTNSNEGDFFIARDESFIIHARPTSGVANLYISYKKNDGSWTNSKSLGNQINTPLWEYGPFVTQDNKYLFFTRGGTYMSSYYTYWVKIDNIIDSLKYTNYVPYVKYPIPDQNGYVGQMFTYTIPDSTFIDDDGNNTLSYQAKLSNGSPLPQWLSFDSVSRTFSGIPAIQETIQIIVTAIDTAGASVSTPMKIVVELPNEIGDKKERGVLIFPNPTEGRFSIIIDRSEHMSSNLEISDMYGRSFYSYTFMRELSLDLGFKPKGMYLLKLCSENETIIRKLILN